MHQKLIPREPEAGLPTVVHSILSFFYPLIRNAPADQDTPTDENTVTQQISLPHGFFYVKMSLGSSTRQTSFSKSVKIHFNEKQN